MFSTFMENFPMKRYEDLVHAERESQANKMSFINFDVRLMDMFSHSTGLTMALVNASCKAGYLKESTSADISRALTKCRLPALGQYLYAEFFNAVCDVASEAGEQRAAFRDFLANVLTFYEAYKGFQSFLELSYDFKWELEPFGEVCIDYTRCRNFAAHNFPLSDGQAIPANPNAEHEIHMPSIGCFGSRITPAYVESMRLNMNKAVRTLENELDAIRKETTSPEYENVSNEKVENALQDDVKEKFV